MPEQKEREEQVINDFFASIERLMTLSDDQRHLRLAQAYQRLAALEMERGRKCLEGR